MLRLPVKRLARLMSVPEDEVDVVCGLDVARQLSLPADHRVHVVDGDCNKARGALISLRAHRTRARGFGDIFRGAFARMN